MSPKLCAIVLCFSLVGCGSSGAPTAPTAPTSATAPPAPAQAAPERPFVLAKQWPVFDGWKAETLDFPLSFAPELAHRGTEELRFAPGMFDPSAPGYWTYAFVWWIEDAPPKDAAALAGELQTYFRGLLGEVAQARRKAPGARPAPAPFDVGSVTATLTSTGERAQWEHYVGGATIFDAFGDGRKLKLQLSVAQRKSQSTGRHALLVLASPAPRTAPIWSELQDAGMQVAGRIPK